MKGMILLVGGPTASGKSALALALAQAFDGVVINADSMQVYRELMILTARPGPDEERRAPHRLYGVLSARTACSAALWREMALSEIARAHGEGRPPILVGGTGLYFRSLLKGLAPVPAIPPEVRTEAWALHQRVGAAAFHAALAERDPTMAARLKPGDTQRLVRAWEVIEATGRSLADWHRAMPPDLGFQGVVSALVLEPPRAELYAACDARIVAMLERGALDEVAALLALDLDPALPAMKAVGVRELARHLNGEVALDQAIRAAQQATRRYAKRQSTWFRNQMADARIVRSLYSDSIERELVEHVGRILLTGDGRASSLKHS